MKKLSLLLIVMMSFVRIGFGQEGKRAENQVEKRSRYQSQSRSAYSISVRSWGSHNIDCSQPSGFCYGFITFYNDNSVWIDMALMKASDEGTPAIVENINNVFVMTIFKSAFTSMQKKIFLKSKTFIIPENQQILPELVKALRFKSQTLKSGKYEILENKETYSMKLALK